MSDLNEFQAEHVETTFAHVDRLLSTIEALARANSSPFARERRDMTAEEGRFLTAFAQQMRMRMAAALDHLGIARPVPTISARHSADVTLRFAEIALADLSSKSLRGYGAVDTDAGAEVDAVAADLRDLLKRASMLFHEQDVGGLAERLAALPGPIGDILRSLERFSTEHAVASVRPLIAEAADRAVARTFDVGVFGHVSAGKSSLINTLVGASVLPIGATPVTAVPLRLHHGDLGAVVNSEDGTMHPITIDEIPRFATEEQNPGNRAGVRSIEIAVPTVPPGLRFLDTPGIGSLSASAPAQAFAWLPRCDMGLVLIAAATPVGTDDLALISGFVRAGIACEILISKVDLLGQEDLTRTVSYVRREVATVLGNADTVPIHPVSIVPEYSTTLTTFRAAILEPLMKRHVQMLHEALRTRLHRLVAMTRTALMESTTTEPFDDGDATAAEYAVREHAQRDFSIRREKARAAMRARTDVLAASTQQIFDTAVHAVVTAWLKDRPDLPAVDAARAAIISETGAALTTVREAVDDVLNVGSAETVHESNVANRRLPPVFDAKFLDELPDLSPPRLMSAPRRTLARHRLSVIRPALQADLGRYASRLYEWGASALSELPEPAWDRGVSPSRPGAESSDELARIDRCIDELPTIISE